MIIRKRYNNKRYNNNTFPRTAHFRPFDVSGI